MNGGGAVGQGEVLRVIAGRRNAGYRVIGVVLT